MADKKQAEVVVDATKQGGVEAPSQPVEAGGENSSSPSERMLLEKVSFLDAELKRVATQRDDLKKSVDEIEAKKLSETQKYKEAFEKLKPEYEELLAFRKSYDGRVKEKLEAVEKKLPKEELPEYEQFIKKLSPEERIDWIEIRLKAKAEVAKPPSSPGANDRPSLDSVSPDRILTTQELLELKSRNPVAYQEYLRKARDVR